MMMMMMGALGWNLCDECRGCSWAPTRSTNCSGWCFLDRVADDGIWSWKNGWLLARRTKIGSPTDNVGKKIKEHWGERKLGYGLCLCEGHVTFHFWLRRLNSTQICD